MDISNGSIVEMVLPVLKGKNFFAFDPVFQIFNNFRAGCCISGVCPGTTGLKCTGYRQVLISSEHSALFPTLDMPVPVSIYQGQGMLLQQPFFEVEHATKWCNTNTCGVGNRCPVARFWRVYLQNSLQ